MSSQTQSHTVNADEMHVPAVVPDPRLTLATKKLAESENCLNCNTALKGPFCYYCGQPDRNFMRFFPALLRDLMEDLLDFDSRFMRTLKPLIFKPGRLTRDFMSGRRFRYTPPMRLYIFSSIVFFLLATLLSSDLVTTSPDTKPGVEPAVIHYFAAAEDQKNQIEETLSRLPADLRSKIVLDPVGGDSTATSTESGGIRFTAANEEEKDHIETVLNDLPPDLHARITLDYVGLDISDSEEYEYKFSPNEITFTGGQPWDRETNPIDIPLVPQWINDRLNDEVENSPKKAKQIEDNPNLFIDQLFDILPATMFLLLPIVALIFKFWYLFAKRYYVEHLIFSLHNHAFIFVCLTIILLLNETTDLLGHRGQTGLATASDWTMVAIWAWIPIYMLISLRVVYQQNWLMTLLKFGAISISYITMLGVVTGAVAVTGFILL